MDRAANPALDCARWLEHMRPGPDEEPSEVFADEPRGEHDGPVSTDTESMLLLADEKAGRSTAWAGCAAR